MRVGRIAVLIVFSCGTILMAAVNGPHIVIDKETYDYGRVQYGDTVKKEFMVTNDGSELLKIDKVRASCGCTKAVNGESEVPPQGHTKIVASFDTNGLKGGKMKKTVTVFTNDPQRPEVELTLYADVVRDVNPDPSRMNLKLSEFKEDVSFPIKITNKADRKVEILGLIPQEEGAAPAVMEPEKLTLDPNSSASVTIKLKLQNGPGKEIFRGGYMLETDHPVEKDIPLRYFIQVEKPA
jgi:hypothetical protein